MPPSLSNLIAAGEVVERPASVVKELLENSIDAGAKNVRVEIDEGGLKKILVRDDGSGMSAIDARMCLLRHASSKIKTSYDLESIRTMGFRGEALPSIVSVSSFEMETSDGVEGTKVVVCGEGEPSYESAPLRKGTTIAVKDLFHNTPARLKYMKAASVERAKAIDVCEHLALGFPSVAFSVNADGREVFSTPGRGEEKEVIQRIWGNGIAKGIAEVEKDDVRDFSLKIFMANPEVNYATRYQIMTFLNARFIYSYKISKAVEEAYRDYLAPLRYPFVAVRIQADPTLVDVNVHPAKREVRISGEERLALEVRNLIAARLKKDKPVYSTRSSSLFFAKESERKKGDQSPPSPSVAPLSSPILEGVETSAFQGNDPRETEKLVNAYQKLQKERLEDERSTASKSAPPSHQTPSKSSSSDVRPYRELCPIGQIAKTYIACESPEGLCLVDQHAAAERINFEKFEKAFQDGVKRVRPLSPLVIELPPSLADVLDEEKQGVLEGMGLLASPFGNAAVKLEEIPSFLTDKDYEEVLKDIVTAVLQGRREDPLALMRKAVSTLSCKASVRAGDPLSPAEQVSLVQNLASCANPANCPHGRPTVVKISLRDLERMFKRTGF